ncbi:MAG: carboxymuconolactone decarboxylase family protein [Bacteroidaceae bacterium]|nr:carboxymuconolactone decarboxylase family protein [Bacteroidaceae bacterium]
MRRIHRGVLAAVLLSASMHLSAQPIMELTDRQQALAAIAAYEAKGDIEALKNEVNKGLEAGLSVSQIKEALSQLYAYTGFPRSLNALGALQQVIRQRQEAGLSTEEGREADPLPADYDALSRGTEVQTQLCGGQPFNYTFAPQTDYYLKAHLFGDIFARNNLTFAEREIVTVSAISALEGCEPQLKAHVSGARNMGVTDAQLHELPAVLRKRVGEAEAIRCQKAVASVLGEECQAVDTVDFSVWPRGVENPYGKYFTGQSYLAEMGAVTNVTFEPGCRNNWHVHHKQVQVLICVAGRGWYQEWGKPAQQMTPGTVIAIPAEVKHWHGAARDSWFQHLTYHKDVQEGAGNEWLEPVDDEWYGKLD